MLVMLTKQGREAARRGQGVELASVDGRVHTSSRTTISTSDDDRSELELSWRCHCSQISSEVHAMLAQSDSA